MNQYIAVIPARGGSKGIRKKNLQQVGNLTLVARAILQAKNIPEITKIIVSTDDDDIVKEACEYDVTIHNRSEHSSTDNAKTINVLLEIANDYNLHDEVCILLQPTSPLRTSKNISDGIDIYNIKNMGSVVSITEAEHHPYKMLINKDGELQPINDESSFEMPRQQLEKAYRINGAVYIARFSNLKKYQSFFINPTEYLVMDNDSSIDIDTIIDLEIANKLIEINKELM